MAVKISSSIVSALVDIKHYRGDSFARVLQFFDDEAETVPTDITNDTFKLSVIKDYTKKNTPVLEFTMDDGIEITDTNEVTLSKTGTQMEVTAGVFLYDLQQTKQDGTIITLMKGEFTIDNDVTKRV